MILIKSKLMNISIITFTALISLIIFDTLLGYFINHNASINYLINTRKLALREIAPNQVFFVEPSDDYLEQSQTLKKKKYKVEVNRNGFITGPNEGVNQNKIDIIFLGGSTTECIFVDDEYRFPFLVSKLLSNNTKKYKTLNGGVSGNNSFHSNLNLLSKVIPENPKFVILMHNVNDISLLSKTKSYWKAPPDKQLVFETKPKYYIILKNLKDILIPNIWLHTKSLISKFRKEKRDDFIHFRGSNENKVDEFLHFFENSLNTFIAISRAWDIEPVLMTQFNRIELEEKYTRTIFSNSPNKISYDKFVEIYKDANNIIRKIAKENNIHLIDLDKLVPKSNKFMYDSMHLNNQGSKLVSKEIVNYLKRNINYFSM